MALAYGSIGLAAWRGRAEETAVLIESAIRDGIARGEGRFLTWTDYATAVLRNGLGDHAAAIEPARRTWEGGELLRSHVLPELVEAAARGGDPELAATAARRLSEHALLSGTDWALGLAARSRALVDERPEPVYREALDRLARSGAVLHRARAQLLYGEWLCEQGRRTEARDQLRSAHEICVAKGAEAFAARAETGLRQAGDAAREQSRAPSGPLTAHQTRIARLARAGYSNADIGAQLFISPRTVEYHLSNVFARLGIESRYELDQALSDHD